VSREQGENVPAHPLLRLCPKPRRAVIVLLTSDRGLCGAFNSNLIRLAVEHAVALEKDGCEVELLLHGKKAVAAFKRRKFKISAKFVGVSDKPSYERADEIAELLSDRFVRGEIDAVEIVYSAFLSAASQRPLARRVLPFVIETGVEGSGAEQVKAVVEANEVPQCEYIFHPAPKEILAVMLPKAVKLEFFTAMLETAAGEHSARRIAMKNATDAADEMIKLLTRNYNRVRQAKITQEIAEIVSGANALG
jgi:F-type H+-transporting ATPase subunit gamma